MHPTLKNLEIELTGSLTGLTSAHTLTTPSRRPDKWCIQQIVGHLLLSYKTTAQLFDSRVAKGRPTLARPTLPQRFAQLYIFRLNRFPGGRRAPEMVCPAPPCLTCSGSDLVRRVQLELSSLSSAIDRAEELFGNKPAISHVALGPMSVERWRSFHLIHGRHHILQILALRAESETD